MADENILQRLGKLFQNSIVLRKTDDDAPKQKRGTPRMLTITIVFEEF